MIKFQSESIIIKVLFRFAFDSSCVAFADKDTALDAILSSEKRESIGMNHCPVQPPLYYVPEEGNDRVAER